MMIILNHHFGSLKLNVHHKNVRLRFGIVILQNNIMRTRKSVNDAYDIFGNPTLMDRHHDIHSYLIPDEERKWWRWFHVRNRGYSIFVHLWKNSKDGICKTVSYTELQREFSLARSRVAIEVKKLEHLGVIEKLKTGIAYNRSVYKVLSPKEARELVRQAYVQSHG